MKDLILSVHIPKTGGTTLRTIFESVYGDSFVWIQQTHSLEDAYKLLSSMDLSKVRLIHGHIPYGLHKFLPSDTTYKYVAFSRDPVDRLISYFNYILLDSTNSVYRWDSKFNWKLGMPFRDWLLDKQIASQDNGMTRFISGNSNLNTDKLITTVTDLEFKLAVRNLTDFCFVGLVDTFSKSLEILANKLSWSFIPKYKIENKTPTGISRSDLSVEDVDLIKSTQSFDCLLWNKVQALYNKFLEECIG